MNDRTIKAVCQYKRKTLDKVIEITDGWVADRLVDEEIVHYVNMVFTLDYFYYLDSIDGK